MQRPSIGIVGGGPAGLTAANILHRHGWEFSVFESDASPSERDQGGTLDLHADGGQLALAKAGLLEAFLSVARHEDQGQRIADHATGTLLREATPEPGTSERPEIDRLVLRQLLLQPLREGMVHWNARLETVMTRPGGGYDLRLYDRIAGPFDLIIGADGAGSRVRAALTDVRPAYSGVTFAELWLTNVDERHTALAELVGHGTLFSLHDGAGLFAQRNGGAMIRVYAAFRTRPEDTDRPDLTLAGLTRPQLLARFEGWAPSLLELISRADHIAAVRPIVALPAGRPWRAQRGLTLVGDAAHVMPPLGVGVNLAMLDAANLAEALVAGNDWWQAVRDYETLMIERATPIAIDCNREFARWFGTEGSQAILEQMDAHLGAISAE